MEFIVKNKKNRKIKIIKEPTDPQCMRVSIGGLKKEGYYLVFRGDSMEDIELMLTETLEAFKEARNKFITNCN